MIVLRDYQTALIDQTRDAMRRGVKRILITAPTGSGKTNLTAHMLASAAARGRRCWFCVHRKELLDQSVSTFIEAADIHTGIVAAQYPASPLAPVQVCSVPSLARRSATLSPPDLIVWDEAHHIASRSWATIAQQFPHATHIGLTATPQRLDGHGLKPFFDVLIQGPTTAELIAHGYLSSYRFYAPGVGPTLDGIHTQAGDFNRKELSDVMEVSTVVGDCVSHYRAHCMDSRALVFAWSLESSRRLAEQFSAASIPAAHVDGETPRAERTAAMANFRSGAIKVLCNVDLFGEGLDVPAVDAVFLLRPTASLGLYLQQVGRGLRPHAGKSVVRIFDHVNNWQRHGLPDDARVWSLDGATKRASQSEQMAKRCAQCFGVSPISAKVCRYCQAPFMVKARKVIEEAGTLQEADLDVLRVLCGTMPATPARPTSLAEWQALARQKGYKLGWAWHQHRLHLTQKRA
jgi:superfamily II DNA or RNA helicase